MDPPWAERGGGKIKRGADRHYSLLSTHEIARVVLSAPCWRPAESAHLWCWVTDNFLLDGLGLIERLGFRYLRTFCWTKVRGGELQIGLGQYARGAHELCLFATRGPAMVPPPANRPCSVILATRTEHSRKPDQAFTEWFESVSPGPRLEMFARTARPGWDAWGNEAPTTQQPADERADAAGRLPGRHPSY